VGPELAGSVVGLVGQPLLHQANGKIDEPA
jgi:hypothetical protein